MDHNEELEKAAVEYATEVKVSIDGNPDFWVNPDTYDAFKAGAEWADVKKIEHVCEWIYNNLRSYIAARVYFIDLDKLNNDLKKAMEVKEKAEEN